MQSGPSFNSEPPMAALTYLKPERISLKSHPELNELWVQNLIAEDPSILGLGELILRDRERIQTGSGRLDLLLQDPDSSSRYEVEIQLGKTDETHIIRTIEYWDLERKRFSQYEHTAVIVAEEITGRFFNVISLFNGAIPVIAIQMQALKHEDKVMLVFTKVLDLRTGVMSEEEDAAEVTDRSYWEKRGSKATVEMADTIIGELLHKLNPNLQPKYNKFYIGLQETGQPNNFVSFRPKKSSLTVEFRLDQSDDIQKLLDDAGVEQLTYDSRWNRYRLRLTKDDYKKNKDLMADLFQRAYQRSL